MTHVFTLIQRDSDVCNNCFRRTHDTVERNYAVDTFRDGRESKLWAREVDLPDQRWPRPDELEPMLKDKKQGTYLACKCGVPHDTVRPVSKERAMEMIERLADRAVEKGTELDKNRLRQMTWRLLSRPEWQGKQDDAFRKALSFAQGRSEFSRRRGDDFDVGASSAHG